MKKTILSILVATAIITMTAACSAEQSGTSSTVTENNKVEENTSDVNQNIKPGVAYSDRKLIGYDIRINTITSRRIKGFSDTTALYGGGESIVSVKPVKEEFNGTYKDILPALNTGKMWKEVKWCFDIELPDDEDFFFTVESESDVEIKGMQCRKITGSVIDKEGKKILGYGYTFIFDNIPFMMMGYVLDESDDAVKQELIDEVEVMINSLRKD